MSSTDETNQAFYFWGILVSGYTFQKGCVPERGLVLGQLLLVFNSSRETAQMMQLQSQRCDFFPF